MTDNSNEMKKHAELLKILKISLEKQAFPNLIFDPNTAQLMCDKSADDPDVSQMIGSWPTAPSPLVSAHTHGMGVAADMAAAPAGPAPVGIFRHMVEGNATELNANLVAACLKAGVSGFDIPRETLDRIKDRVDELTDTTVECIINTVWATGGKGGPYDSAKLLWAISKRLAPKTKEE